MGEEEGGGTLRKTEALFYSSAVFTATLHMMVCYREIGEQDLLFSLHVGDIIAASLLVEGQTAENAGYKSMYIMTRHNVIPHAHTIALFLKVI